MTTISFSTSTTIPETTPHNDSTNENYHPEIIAYFISRFQQQLISSFPEREDHLDIKSNSEIMFGFLQERQYNGPMLFIGVEGTDDIESCEDKNLLMKWGLQKKQ